VAEGIAVRLLLVPLHGAFLVIFAGMLLIKLFALVDALIRPANAFPAADKQTKKFWLMVTGLAVLSTVVGFLSIVGLVAALVYLVDVRPAVKDIPRGGQSQHMGPYGPW
jgi:hypothetical protein